MISDARPSKPQNVSDVYLLMFIGAYSVNHAESRLEGHNQREEEMKIYRRANRNQQSLEKEPGSSFADGSCYIGDYWRWRGDHP